MDITELTKDDASWAINTLTKAFMNDPIYKFIYGEQLSEKNLAYLQNVFFNLGLNYGAGFTTTDKSGTIFILPPKNVKIDAFKMLKSGLLKMMVNSSFSSLSKGLAYSKTTEKAILGLNLPEHYHLTNFAVSPDKQGQGVGKKLMNHVLAITDKAKLPVYLETSEEANLGLYRRFDFEVVAEDEVASSGVMKLSRTPVQPR